jgi:hypothetical protein
MSDKQFDPDAERLDACQAALTKAGYEIYEAGGRWFYNDISRERNPDFADGPYDDRKQVLHVAVRNLGLELDGDDDEPVPELS